MTIRRTPETTWGKYVRVAALAALAAALCVGCDDDTETSPEQESAPEADTGTSDPDGTSLEEKRSAFGLPFPPKVRGVRRLEAGVEVTTRMELDALEEFYQTRLVDYEIVRPDPQKIRVLGLREFMPAIRGHRYGPVSVLYYSPAPEEPTVDTGPRAESDTGIERPSVGAAEQQREKRPEPGTPVQLETDDGEPLAPGARWGEPYTPPEGSPLHKPRYRANFGKPFGEWQLP